MGINLQYIVPIAGMAFVSWLAYLQYKEKQFNTKERSALIEKGIDPAGIDPALIESKQKNKQNSLKIGLILIGIAVGVSLGYILNLTLGIPDFVAYSSMILIICGIILICFYKSKTE